MHLDQYIPMYFNEYHGLMYLFMFICVFCETGLVITPFLPGDSLIFAAAAVQAIGGGTYHSSLWILFIVFYAAAVLGNTSNYSLGRLIGNKIYHKEKHRFIKKKSLDAAMNFFNRRGGVTIIVTRFMPIIRTFTPFVAGISEMRMALFTGFNLIGGLLWVGVFLTAGHFFGKIPFVATHITVIMLAIVVISICPAVIMKLTQMIKARKQTKG